MVLFDTIQLIRNQMDKNVDYHVHVNIEEAILLSIFLSKISMRNHMSHVITVILSNRSSKIMNKFTELKYSSKDPSGEGEDRLMENRRKSMGESSYLFLRKV